MQWWEVNRYRSGLFSRSHAYWEMTRLIHWCLACIYHDPKSGPAPAHPDSLYKYPWEKEQSETAVTEQDAQKAKEELDFWNNQGHFAWN